LVSLLLLEQATVVEVRRQADHSPTMTLPTYAHLFEEQRAAARFANATRFGLGHDDSEVEAALARYLG
jgi:hypothetical protein